MLWYTVRKRRCSWGDSWEKSYGNNLHQLGCSAEKTQFWLKMVRTWWLNPPVSENPSYITMFIYFLLYPYQLIIVPVLLVIYYIYMYNTIYPLNLFASHMFRQHQVQFSLDLPHSLDSWHILAHLGTSWPQNKTLICSWTNGFVWYGTNVAGMRNLMFNQWTWLFVRYFSDKPAQTTLSNLWNNTLQLHFFSDLAAKHSQWGRQRLVDSHPRNSWNRCFFILPYFEA